MNLHIVEMTFVIVRNRILSVADYDSTLMGVVVVVALFRNGIT